MKRFRPGRLVAALALAFGIAPGVAHADPDAKIPIRHVIVIVQENRSFDNYFGTYPGADGIPAGVCMPLDPARPDRGCVKPFHDQNDVNAGGPHGPLNALGDLDDGISADRMDGFLFQQSTARNDCAAPNNPECASSRIGVARHDVIGYHDQNEIPNYWDYAKHFVLQDRLFEGVRSWSWPSHLYITSEWSAVCPDQFAASTCVTNPNAGVPKAGVQLPWVTLFQLLDVNHVSWKYYLGSGLEPDCDDDEMTCDPQVQTAGVPSIWNPAPFFAWVKAKGPAYLNEHNPNIDRLLVDINNGTLPSVSWVVPSAEYSEHPPSGITEGMEYVTGMVNAVMQSPYWKDTAIFVVWDDWGGFYDHVAPPNVDLNSTEKTPIQGYGIRVPGLVISAYAKAGKIDHNLLSLDSYATFIEDLFMGGARLNPAELHNPDHRPDIRDALTHVVLPDGRREAIGSLMDDFDFHQKPLPPLILSTHIPTGITAACGAQNTERCKRPKVKVSWNPVTGPDVAGPFIYHVERNGVDLPQCTGIATYCWDTPGKGVHYYRVYSVDQIFVASPRSAAAEVLEP